MSKLIVNCETGEESLIELTKAEENQQKKDEVEIPIKQAALEAQTKAEATNKADLLAKLGITAEEAKLLLS